MCIWSILAATTTSTTMSLVLTVRRSDRQYWRSFFGFAVSTITHEPLHSAWWYFARTCTLTTAWTLLNFKVIGQRSRPQELFCASEVTTPLKSRPYGAIQIRLLLLLFLTLGTPFQREPKNWLILNQVGMTVSPVGPEHKNCRATKHHWTVARQLKCAEKETEFIIIIISFYYIFNTPGSKGSRGLKTQWNGC